MPVSTSDIADPSLAAAGRARIEWADAQMPVLRSIRERLADERPLEGITVAACLHVTAETANLVRALVAGGAEVALCAANPLSTQDETAAALAEDFGAEVHARRGEDAEAYAAHVAACARRRPHVTLDDGADLVMLMHHARARVRERLIGGTEETTTGLLRVRALEAEGRLTCPVIAVNEAHAERIFNDHYGTGQSALDGILRATNILLAGQTFVIFGYGWTGRGLAQRARGAGAQVVHLRGRSRARPRGADRGLRGHARARGGRARRRLRHRHRLARGPAPRALRAHEGRRRSSPTPGTSTSRSTPPPPSTPRPTPPTSPRARARPHMTLDDGADLVMRPHHARARVRERLIGGTEETTTGLLRVRALEAEGRLTCPVIAVNEAHAERIFNDHYGTGQSALDGILRATNILLAGQTFVIFGYGWTGRGLAQRARGAGAQVVICEVDPVRALEARMEGFEVMPALEAAARGDVFVTVTGSRAVLRREHFERMKDGAILANAGHFDVEIDLDALRAAAVEVRDVLPLVQQYDLGERRLNLLASGRVVNLAAGQGHPAAVMDMSFALQALVVEDLVARGRDLAPGVHPVPEAIDREVARLKLAALGVGIDELTPEQATYRDSWG